MITSQFPIDIVMLPDLAHDSSDYMSGPTVPTDVTLPSCPPSLPLLYFPNPFPTESRLSQVQCSVLLVVPEFQTLSPFDHLPFPTFGYRSPSVFTFVPLSHSVCYAPLSFRLALYLFFLPILHTLPMFIVWPSVC